MDMPLECTRPPTIDPMHVGAKRPRCISVESTFLRYLSTPGVGCALLTLYLSESSRRALMACNSTCCAVILEHIPHRLTWSEHRFDRCTTALRTSLRRRIRVYKLCGMTTADSANRFPDVRVARVAHHFNLPLASISQHLVALTLGNQFNKDIAPGVLPRSLRSITFGVYFNQSLRRGSVPHGVRLLKFGDRFNAALQPHVLPTTLHTLVFTGVYNHIFDQRVLPVSLRSLTLSHRYNQSLLYLPVGLQHLRLRYDYNLPLSHLPDGLHSVTLGYSYNQLLLHLPDNLHTLRLGYLFNQSLDTLPNGLKLLCARGSLFNKPLRNLPLGLEKLTVSNHYTHALPSHAEYDVDVYSTRSLT